MRKAKWDAESRRAAARPAMALLLLLLSGCVGLPRHVQKYHSDALHDPQTTVLGRLVAAEEGNKNLSAFAC